MRRSGAAFGLIFGLTAPLGLASATSVASRPASPPTEVVVIGTVHRATPSYSAQDLLRILEKVKPDVILFEYPADMMTPAFEFQSVVKGALEQEAVIDYVRRTGAKIRPYDIDGRNGFYETTDYFARQRQCNQDLNAQIEGKTLAPEAQKIADALRAANARRDEIGASSPLAINGFQADAAISQKQWLMNQGIPEIVRLTPALVKCQAFWDLSRGYWTRRNNEMVANIQRSAQAFAGKRLAVLCGYEHRYQLRSALLEWTEHPSYVVKEYWEY